MTSTIQPDAVYFSNDFHHPHSDKGFFDNLPDDTFVALMNTGINLVVGGLWTWAAIAAFSAGPVGWTIAGCFFAAFAVVNALVALGSLFNLIG